MINKTEDNKTMMTRQTNTRQKDKDEKTKGTDDKTDSKAKTESLPRFI